VSQYLDSKLAAAAGEAKVSLAAVLTWALVTCAVAAPLGGTDAYTDSIAILTEGALQMGNLVYLWAALLGYFSIKVVGGGGRELLAAEQVQLFVLLLACAASHHSGARLHDHDATATPQLELHHLTSMQLLQPQQPPVRQACIRAADMPCRGC
jgi:hypothetical protein